MRGIEFDLKIIILYICDGMMIWHHFNILFKKNKSQDLQNSTW